MAICIVLQGKESISTERTRQHSNVTEDRFQRLVENVGHFVFEVLTCHQRVEQTEHVLTLSSLDLTSSAGNIGVLIKCLPQVVERHRLWSSSNIEQNTNVGLKGTTEGIEEPSVRVQLFLVVFLQTKDNLARHYSLLGTLELEIIIEGDLRSVLVHVCLNFLLVDNILRNTLLVNTQGGQCIERTWVDLLTSISDDANDNLLPTITAPSTRLGSRAEVADIPHDTVHSTGETDFVFVVHGDTNKQLSLASGSTNLLAKLISPFAVVVRIGCDSGISHVREFALVTARQEAVKNGGNFALQDKLAVDQLNFLFGDLLGSDTATPLLVRCWAIVKVGIQNVGFVLVFIIEVNFDMPSFSSPNIVDSLMNDRTLPREVW